MKEETTNNSLRALDLGTLTTLGTLDCINQRKVMVINMRKVRPIAKEVAVRL
jgi:hypothetical protein